MKNLRQQLKKLFKIERRSYHPLIHKIHKTYGISRKTLHYVKSYGPHKHITLNIIKQSILILFFASVFSSLGGIFLESIKSLFVTIVPLIILMPTLNDMIGDYGMIISSHFTTLLYKGKIKGHLERNDELKELFFKVIVIAFITGIFSGTLSLIISGFSGYVPSLITASKIFVLILIDIIILITLLFLISFFLGRFVYKKNEDPDNFLIPITTSIADFGNMIVITLLVILFF